MPGAEYRQEEGVEYHTRGAEYRQEEGVEYHTRGAEYRQEEHRWPVRLAPLAQGRLLDGRRGRSTAKKRRNRLGCRVLHPGVPRQGGIFLAMTEYGVR